MLRPYTLRQADYSRVSTDSKTRPPPLYQLKTTHHLRTKLVTNDFPIRVHPHTQEDVMRNDHKSEPHRHPARPAWGQT
ncbi:hypothetical protein BJV78DRAFT_1173972 [Lactifluus subvellereus]|nr:hypothetical protein BJV78DRAFT_1173972 [Lactifluus subvellereus]